MNEVASPSPNFQERDPGSFITRIILHDTESSAKEALAWLSTTPADRKKQTGVESYSSTHVLIDKLGIIYRLVPDSKKAWGCKGHNTNSLQIELEMLKTDPDGTFTPEQLAASAEWCAEKCIEYRIPLNRIVSHASLDPARRTDPRGFDFYEFLLEVASWVDKKEAESNGGADL